MRTLSRALMIAAALVPGAIESWAQTAAPSATATAAPAGDAPRPPYAVRRKAQSERAEAQGLAEPFKGITTNGTVTPGLFALRSTGVSTEPVRTKTLFPVDDPEWRKWMNQHFYVRQGVSFTEMTDAQRQAALGLLAASLSAKGLQLSRDIMRLNHTLGELNGDNWEEYGEWLYSITVMGAPSATEPWGWQIDGHHLIVNYFVLGDQVVMTPAFWGSEPVVAAGGKYAGTSILQREQDLGLALVRALPDAQRARAILRGDKTGNDNVGEAFRDNVVLDYAGLPAKDMSAAARRQLRALISLFVSNLREDQARVQMADVERHLDATHFAWIGGTSPDAVFYYRIHSPVILIEFDHQRPANLAHQVADRTRPVRSHIHVVVRTPNGNDYGKDLLRQHHEKSHRTAH
jgi:Protein of unknown function (DUF3500)